MSLAKLTSLSTQTLSLLLERQRLHSLGQKPSASSTQNIIRNLGLLREGILNLRSSSAQSSVSGKNGYGKSEAVELLGNQFTRMRDMLGSEAGGVEPLPAFAELIHKDEASPSGSISTSSPPLPPQKEPVFVPYSDEPPPSPEMEPGAMLQQQRMLMDEQDSHLDALANTVGRQRDIAIQINDELDVHTGLLETLDQDVENTHQRLSGARKRLDRFGRGVKGNWSTYIIALLILVLLILIIIFKT